MRSSASVALESYNNTAVVVCADRVGGNALEVLDLGMDDPSLIGAHRLKSNSLLVLKHLLCNTSCQTAQGLLTAAAVVLDINGHLDMLKSVCVALTVGRKVAEILESLKALALSMKL